MTDKSLEEDSEKMASTVLSEGFWDKKEKPIIGLAPMDGITDASFRYIVAKYGKPSLTITEFTNVEGLARGAVKMLTAFLYSEIERPVVAQIYGTEVDSFYKATVMLCAMGFDGVDINMGCPVNKVARKGSGAGLIKTPLLAREIIRACKKGAVDFSEGISLEEAGVHEDIISALKVEPVERRLLPISVKTRIGYDEVVVEEWMKNLLEERPANISLHGRTLKQLYTGKADWEAIGKAAQICKKSGVNLLGNGDVISLEDALEKVREYGVDGVLIGRAALGNPWIFSGHVPTVGERLDVLLEHMEYFDKLNHLHFHNIRKHLAWYCSGFEGAKELRKELMGAENAGEVMMIVGKF